MRLSLTNLVCVLSDPAIPTSSFNFIQLDHSHVVSFNSKGSNNELESLKNNIENVFQDVFSTPPAPFFLKLFNKEWEQFIDVCAGQSIPDKGVIRVYLLKESKVGELK